MNASQPGWLQRLGLSAFDASDSPDDRLRKSLLLLTAAMTNVAAGVWVAIFWFQGVRVPTSLPVGYQVASAALLLYYVRTRNFRVYRFTQLALFLVVPVVIQWTMGGYVSSFGIVLLSMLAPLGALLAYGRKGSLGWFVAYLVLVIVTTAWQMSVGGDDEHLVLTARSVAAFGVLHGIVLSSIAFFLLRHLVLQREKFQAELAEQHVLLKAEREKSEALLHSVLPPYIAHRLKRDSALIADGHADVTVMFADIVDFTRLASVLEPTEVVGLLNHVFRRMDQLCERHGLEKIKTVGDAYMVAGGLDFRTDDYVDAMADMALELHTLFANNPIGSKWPIRFHVGIATGPAVAGVIGATRFGYDVWGDTVNIAARLTSDTPADATYVDRTTYDRLAGRYDFGEPLEMHFKGKGYLQVFPLLGRRSARDAPSTLSQSAATAERSLASASGGTRA
ncbi:MAG: adenylate/guanylate cyclase domain-containing protein [Betaproteobacteria bacterium]|nr:adenylate/guanylate cyclase domain-containing protein [Betaproteobacteria bacterium]